MLSTNNIFSPAHGGPIIAPVAGHRARHLLPDGRPRRRSSRRSRPAPTPTRSSSPTARASSRSTTTIKLRLDPGTRGRDAAGPARAGVDDRDDRRPRALQRHPARRACRSTTTRSTRRACNGLISDCHKLLGKRRHAAPARRHQGDRLQVGDARRPLVRQERHASSRRRRSRSSASAEGEVDRDPEAPPARRDHARRALHQDHRHLDPRPRRGRGRDDALARERHARRQALPQPDLRDGGLRRARLASSRSGSSPACAA